MPVGRNLSDSLLEVSDLRTRIGAGGQAARVVDGIDLAIARGETYALLGESGCGKSMTALSIMRLLPHGGRILAGSVKLDGQELLALPESAMRQVRGGRIAMIFQEPQTSLNPVLTVASQIGESLQQHTPLRGEQRRARIVELLNAVGIPDPERRLDEYPHQLSGGMKQRVMIAMALAGEPDLLIADEPTTALDVTIQAQVLDLLRDLQQRTGMAILLITHDLGVVAQVADRVAVMYAGHVVEQASAGRFFASPAHPYSRKLFDSLPSVDKREKTLAVIPGTVPPLTQAFRGCRFESRCTFTFQACQSVQPAVSELTSEHWVRCHLHDPAYPESISAEEAQQQASVSVSKGNPAELLNVNDLKVYFPIRKGLFKRVAGHVRAVDGVSLTIPTGTTLALVGESGCGKTTTGKGIVQLIRPSAGSVSFEGDELTELGGERLRRRRSDIQFIFQDPYASMNPRMLVADIVAEGMVAQRIGNNRQERIERVERLLDDVGMSPDAMSRYPHEFSGGQRQRICIARALAVEPKLIVCDEPTSALDVSVQAQILNLLKELQDKLGLAYLFITHNLAVVEYLAHEIAVMYLGRIVESGSAAEVLNDPRHPYTQALLSAVPVMDKETKRTVIRLEGDLPSPSAPPNGCHFSPRCAHVRPECREVYPGAKAFSETHQVRCVL